MEDTRSCSLPCDAGDDWESMSKEELEYQYSPSRWCPEGSSDVIIDKYLAAVRSDIARCRNQLMWRTVDIQKTADNDSNLSMDVYGEDLPPGSPLFVFVHGGYWQELSKEEVGGLMAPLYAGEILTVVLPYTIAPEGTVTQMVLEVARGVRQAHQLAQGRGAATVVLAGWSAGAQLVMQALLSELNKLKSDEPPQSLSQAIQGQPFAKDVNVASDQLPKIKGICTISGVFDLRPLVETYVNDLLKLNRYEAWRLSPSHSSHLRHLADTLPLSTRFLVAAAEHDSPQFRRQTKQYAASLRRVGFGEVEDYLVPSSDHFRIISDLSRPDDSFSRRILHFVKQCDAM